MSLSPLFLSQFSNLCQPPLAVIYRYIGSIYAHDGVRRMDLNDVRETCINKLYSQSKRTNCPPYFLLHLVYQRTKFYSLSPVIHTLLTTCSMSPPTPEGFNSLLASGSKWHFERL